MKSPLLHPQVRRCRALFICAVMAAFFGLSSVASSRDLGPADLAGVWTGRDLRGAEVVFTLSEDGAASISSEGEVVLGAGEKSEVRWRLVSEGKRQGLDLVFSNEFGLQVVSKYLIRGLGENRIELRFGGLSEARPEEFSASSDPMRIVLTRGASSN